MKPWSEVEQSKEYKTLSPQEQDGAKKEYWDTVVTQKKEFQSLPQRDREMAQMEFFGKQVQTQAPGMGERLAGIGRGALDLGKRAITPLMSPEQIMQNPIARQVVRGGLSPVTPAPIIAPESFKAGHLSGLTSPLAIASGALGMGKFAKSANLLPAKMGKGYLLDRATRGAKELEGMRISLGQAKGQAVARVAEKTVSNFKPDIPEAILNKLQDPIYKIEFTNSGAIKNTIGNIDRVKDALGDTISNTEWAKVSSKTLVRQAKQLYGYLNKAIKGADSSLEKPLSAFHKFMKDYGRLKSVFSDTKGVVSSRMESAITSDKSEAAFNAWKNLSKKSPELKQIMKDIGKYAGRKGTKKIFRDIARWGIRGAAIGGGGYGVLRKLRGE